MTMIFLIPWKIIKIVAVSWVDTAFPEIPPLLPFPKGGEVKGGLRGI
jgi:hypothetical protein